MATLRDIAGRAGTSVSTVSLVLNDRATAVRISDATRDAVLAAAAELGYAPHLAARRLRVLGDGRERTARQIVLAVAHPMDSRLSLVSRIVAGIQRQVAAARAELDELGCEVQLTMETFVPGELHRLRGLDAPLWYNGLLVTNTAPPDDALLASGAIGVPAVVFQRATAGSHVNVDNRAAGRTVAEHLVGLGHRRMAVVTPGIVAQAQALRIAGFDEGLAAAGLPPAEVVGIQGSSWTGDGYAAAERLLERSAGSRPSAIFAVNDLLALGVIRAARDRGAAVPDELAVVGCDDAEFAAFAVPALTTVHLPFEEMAAAAAEILLGLIQRRIAGPVHRLFPSRLVVRESCGASSAARLAGGRA